MALAALEEGFHCRVEPLFEDHSKNQVGVG